MTVWRRHDRKTKAIPLAIDAIMGRDLLGECGTS
jgi:hypothetical protein